MTAILFICMMTWMAVSSTPNPKEKPHQEFKHSLNRRILVLRTSCLVAETYTHACFQTVESDPWMFGLGGPGQPKCQPGHKQCKGLNDYYCYSRRFFLVSPTPQSDPGRWPSKFIVLKLQGFALRGPPKPSGFFCTGSVLLRQDGDGRC